LAATDADKAGPDVFEALNTTGEALVVIALDQPASLETVPLELDTLRRDVAQLQNLVLASLSEEEFRLTHRYQAVPALAGALLSESGLAKLAANPAVTKVDLDVGGSGSLGDSIQVTDPKNGLIFPRLDWMPASEPNLTIPNQLPAIPGASVAVPVNYTANGNDISSLIFSVDLDENWLDFDPTDGNGDGIPDDVALNLPAGFNASVSYDASDTDGELDFFLGDTFPPLTGLPDSTPATITLTAGQPCPPTEAPVGFSGDPAPSFGNTAGQSVPGTWDDGSVLIGGRCDFNQDGTINVLDIQMIANCWSEPIGGPCDARYDLDNDGDIDILDLQRVAGAFMS
jgi:hypothetical protein